MKKRFESVRIYDDPRGFKKPYSNIEFVVGSGLRKVVEVLKLSSKERVCPSKYQDEKMVVCPQNYEEFKKYLSQTQVASPIGDIKVVYHEKAPLIAQRLWDKSAVTLYYDNELFTEGYETLLALATEMLYDGMQRDEKTENHLKRTFRNQANKVHRELLEENQKTLK